MAWYLGCAIDDLVVPNNKEMSDMLAMFPSPNDWSQWELSSSTAFEPMNKGFNNQKDFTDTGLDHNGKILNKVDMKLFDHQQDGDSINSNISQELNEVSVNELNEVSVNELNEGSFNEDTSLWDMSDYQLEDLNIINQTDDVFLNSSLDIGAVAFTGPFNSYNAEFGNDQNGLLPGDSFFDDMTMESECDPSHLFGMGSSKYFKTHHFSQPIGGGSGLYTPQFSKFKNNPPSPLKAHYKDFSVSTDFEIMDKLIKEETLPEASVLREFESAMTQMSHQTRICFRDALYRLAESSSQHTVDLPLVRSSPLMVSDGNIWSGNSNNTEAETNSIDRTVANLIFYKMDTDLQNLPHCRSSGDAEVPRFG